MKSLLSIIVTLGLALAFSMPGIAAQRPGAVVSVRTIGLSENGTSARANHKLNRQINHWTHINRLSKVRVGAARGSCTKGAGGFYSCTRSARVAG
jgi:hypothetical protein